MCLKFKSRRTLHGKGRLDTHLMDDRFAIIGTASWIQSRVDKLSHPPAFTNLFGVGLHGWLEIHNAALVLGSRIFITTANHHRDDIFGADASSTQLWNHLQIVEEISFLTHETFLINFFHFVFQYSPPCVTILCLRSDTSGRQSCKNNKKSVENEIRKTISEYWKRFLSPSVSFRA